MHVLWKCTLLTVPLHGDVVAGFALNLQYATITYHLQHELRRDMILELESQAGRHTSGVGRTRHSIGSLQQLLFDSVLLPLA